MSTKEIREKKLFKKKKINIVGRKEKEALNT